MSSNEEDVSELLITEIQARPALWNTQLASYKNKNLRDRLYNEVAEILNISKETVAARWKNKKDKYRRELKKIPKPRSGDPGNIYKSTWPYFQMMTFLKYLMTPANKSGNLATNNSQQKDRDYDYDIDIEEEELLDTTNTNEILLKSPQSVSTASVASPQEEERPSSASASSTVFRNKSTKKRLCDIRDDKFLELENKKLQLLTENLRKEVEKPENENLNFFKSLIPYMDRIKNPIHKLQVRNDIQQVILNKLSSIENSTAGAHTLLSPVGATFSNNTNYPENQYQYQQY